MGFKLALGWEEPLTYRQYMVYLTWLNREEMRPKLIHYHLMQVAAEVRRANERIKHPQSVKLSDFDLSPDEDDSSQAQATNHGPSPSSRKNPPARRSEAPRLSEEEKERRAAISRSRWGAIMGAYQQGARSVPAEGAPAPAAPKTA